MEWQVTTNQENAWTITQWVIQMFSFEVISAFLLKFIIAVVVTIVLLVVSRIATNFIKKKIRTSSLADDDEYIVKVSSLIGDMVFFVLAAFSFTAWLKIVWIDFWLLIWWLSIWVWFAFKEVLWNLLAWVMILTTKEYKIWDIIEVDYNNNEKYFGRIEEITIRYTVLRAINFRKVIVPNLALITQPVRTYTSEDRVRLETYVPLSINSDIDKCTEIMKEAVNSIDFVIDKKDTAILLDSFDERWLKLRAMFFFDPNYKILYLRAISEVNKAIFRAFQENWIEIPYPHTTFTVDKNDKNLLSSAMFLIKWKNWVSNDTAKN